MPPHQKEEREKILHELYYNIKKSSLAFTSRENIFRGAKKLLPALKRKDVDLWFEKQLTYTLHKPVRYNFPRNKTIVMSINDQWQADLCDMTSKKNYNDGYTFLLTCIDCFSKRAWAVPLLNKTAEEIIKGLQWIIETSKKSPKRLQTDKGTEFINVKVQSFLKKYNIHFFTTNGEKKASIVERLNRTLKLRMFKFFTANNTYRYIDVLQSIVDGYNDTYHRSIKMKPNKVRKIHQPLIRERLYGNTRAVKKYKYELDDRVRISKNRQVFDKGYLPFWTEEIFTIRRREYRLNEVVYYLSDFNGENVQGGFYEKEIQKVQELDEYRIETVLRTKKSKGKTLYLVKWKGWSDKFNSWIENPHSL